MVSVDPRGDHVIRYFLDVGVQHQDLLLLLLHFLLLLLHIVKVTSH